MLKTTNLNLNKPEGTDAVNIEDLNENADVIDGKFAGGSAGHKHTGAAGDGAPIPIGGIESAAKTAAGGNQANRLAVTGANGRVGDAERLAGLTLEQVRDGVTKDDVGLSNVDNVKQASKQEFDAHLVEDASLTKKGHVQLSSAVDSTSELLAATPKAVRDALDWVKGYGLGANTRLLADANLPPNSPTSFYMTNSNTLNIPFGEGTLIHISRDSRPTQQYITFFSESMFIRGYTASGWGAWKEVVLSTPLNWLNAALQNNWQTYSGRTAQYAKDAFGRVHLRGTIAGGVTAQNTRIFTLPSDYRPGMFTKAITASWKGGESPPTSAVLNIGTSGYVEIDYAEGNDWLSLDGIYFFT